MLSPQGPRRMPAPARYLRHVPTIDPDGERLKEEAALLADVLNGLAAALFIVNTDGRIVHANANGHLMLSAGAVLQSASGRLSAVDPHACRALQAAFAAVGLSDIALTTRTISVPLSAVDGKLFVAHVNALASGSSRNGGSRGSPRAAVFVRTATLDLAHSLATVAETYGLTPAETRVMTGIIEFSGVPEAAPMLGIAETTVKTHLGRVYDKTGTRRQVDLVKLVAQFTSPFAGKDVV